MTVHLSTTSYYSNMLYFNFNIPLSIYARLSKNLKLMSTMYK